MTKTNLTVVNKIKVKSITINWAESFLIPNEGVTVSTFKEVQTIIDNLATEQIGKGGYCKTGFTIEWEDGREHQGRIDLTSKNNMDSNSIGEHVKGFYRRLACLDLMSGYTLEQQRNYVIKLEKVNPEEVAEILETYALEDIEPTPEPTNEVKEEDTNEVTVKLNDEKNGVEIYFSRKPSEEIRNELKANKFRWSNKFGFWYAKQNQSTLSLAEKLGGGVTTIADPPDKITSETVEVVQFNDDVELFEFTDITTFTINEETEKRLIDNSLFSGNRYVGLETKNLQNTLQSIKDLTVDAIEYTDSVHNKNTLINDFNLFCERYSKELEGYLYKQSITVSWAVTGRGNLNVANYNKKQDQLQNKMSKVVEMLEKKRSSIAKYKKQFKKEQNSKYMHDIQQLVASGEVKLVFSTKKRKIEYYGLTYDSRSYESLNYWFMKLAGCYRIFESNTGKEVHSMKTADKLTDTKKYVLYLESKINNI